MALSYCPNIPFCRAAILGLSLFVGGLGAVAPANSAEHITFEDILAAPNDLQLNLDYARQEVKSGRLQQAAAALERLLLIRPNWDSIRLFYGVVLYRLDDLSGAIRELSVLEGRNLSSGQEQDRVKYLALASKGNDPIRMTSRYTLGARIDSNPARLPDNILVAAVPVDDDADGAITGSSQFRIEADIGGAAGNYLFFQSNAYINDYFTVDTADLIATRARAGIVLHGPDITITPYFLYGSSWLQYEQFRSQYGGGIDTSLSLSSQVEFSLNARAAYEDYKTTDFSTVGDMRDGWRKSIEAGLKYRTTDAQTFSLKGRFARKDADFDGFSYNESKVTARSLTLFGEGRFLSLSASYMRTEYDEPDNFLSAIITREDDDYFARAAVGAPLGTIFAEADFNLPDSISDIVLQLGVSYSSQDSTINRLEHSNWSGDILFTKRVRF